MTPAKRRPATSASKGPTRTAPDVPVVADPPPPVPPEKGTELLGPDGAPTKQDAPTQDAGADSAPPTDTEQVDPEDPATKQSPRRSRGRYPLPVWPD